jgi:hypothetical protein
MHCVIFADWLCHVASFEQVALRMLQIKFVLIQWNL